jgi:hypothetical protein
MNNAAAPLHTPQTPPTNHQLAALRPKLPFFVRFLPASGFCSISNLLWARTASIHFNDWETAAHQMNMGSYSGTQPAYSFSFTAASLRPDLMRIAAEIFLASDGWDAAKARILATNALQCRTATSAIRMEREMRQRLQLLTRPQLALLVEAPAEDRAAIAWLAACKHSAFVFDFAVMVLRDKLGVHDPVLRLSDYETFVELQSVSHLELGALTPSSKVKVRRVLFLMLTESGLISPDTAATHRIHRPVLSPAVAQAIGADSPRWLAAFLVPESEIPHP